jgi:hypothetical protein
MPAIKMSALFDRLQNFGSRREVPIGAQVSKAKKPLISHMRTWKRLRKLGLANRSDWEDDGEEE